VGDEGDDTLHGGDGSDMFVFAAGDGKDVACGGAGAGWTDTIDVTGLHLTMATYGSEWTLSLTKGSVLSYDDHQATFSQDSDGIIALNDGTQIHFQHVERLIG
jgi:large repetitive protein